MNTALLQDRTFLNLTEKLLFKFVVQLLVLCWHCDQVDKSPKSFVIKKKRLKMWFELIKIVNVPQFEYLYWSGYVFE